VKNPCDQIHWWSNHPGGAMFLNGDGSVRFLPYSTSIPVFQALSTRNGGETLNAP
jgi:hypothetical protein